MPNKTITILAVTTMALLAGYVACMATAIFFATLRTELTAQVRASEIRVGALETEYYQAIGRIDESEVALRGFVTPNNVNYVAVDGTPTLTRADR